MLRRDFLKTFGAACALGAGAPKALAGSTRHTARATADRVIVLWMAGGMAHTETFDPKAYTPFEVGLDPSRVLSTFPSIPTKIDGVRFSEGLERIAAVMDRGTVCNTYTAGDLGFILHSRHQYHWHTGYAPPQTVAAPHIGSWIARKLGPLNPDVPAFIDIGQRFSVGEAEELKAFHTAGFLGSEYGPFLVPDPRDAAAAVRPPGGMSAGRFQSRERLFRRLVDASPIGREGSEAQRESLLRSLDNAHRLLNSPAAAAFDLSLEPEERAASYGASHFGRGCLLARRLIEAGARFIEVTTEYAPFERFDTHEDGHTRMRDLKAMIDAPVAQLVLDLEERGLLDRTLIVLASEFSRDMVTEGKPGKKVRDQVEVPQKLGELKHYGMHRHFTDAGSLLLFGGGIKKGARFGVTQDERPCKTIEDPVRIEDLHATIFHALGIPPDAGEVTEGRPFYVTKDGLGRPIERLFG